MSISVTKQVLSHAAILIVAGCSGLSLLAMSPIVSTVEPLTVAQEPSRDSFPGGRIGGGTRNTEPPTSVIHTL